MTNLTKEIAKELSGKRIYLTGEQKIDWFTRKINERFTIFYDERDGVIWFFKKKNSMRGLRFSSIDNPMYELV